MQTIHRPVGDPEIDRLVDWLKEMTRRYYAEHYSNLPAPVFEVHKGTVNTKIVKKNRPEDKGGSVYCFIENATGKIMKAATYKAPDPKRYERGNVNNPETWQNCCQPHGIVYLK